jgi:hypothetical protein
MHVAARFHPNISTSNFSARERVRQNDTENFIRKVMTEPEDHMYVLRRVREDDASGKNRKFNVEVAERIATKGREARDRREVLEEDRWLERARLAAVGLELDLDKVNAMTVAKLRDQLRISSSLLKTRS